MAEIWFVTGGARSGKSRFAERLAASTDRAVVYIATMEASDEELRARIAAHRAQRPDAWHTVEAPLELASALASIESDTCALIDCVSLWVNNRLLPLGESPTPEAVDELEAALREELDRLIDQARARSGPVIVVSNEVGAGVVPEYPLGRVYRDLLGRTNQQLASAADRAWLLVAGRTLELPPPTDPLT